jgi:hypothetical protein
MREEAAAEVNVSWAAASLRITKLKKKQHSIELITKNRVYQNIKNKKH